MKQMLPHIGFIFKRNIRDKKNIYYIIMMSVCSFTLLCAFLFHHMYNYSDEWDKENNIYFRQLMLTPGYEEAMKFFENPTYDFHMEKLLEIENVVDVHESDYDEASLKNVILNDEIHGDIVGLGYGSKDILPKIISGTDFNVDDKDVLVCPNKMYLYGYNYLDEVNKKEIIDTKKYIGSTIKGSYDIKYYDEKTDSIKIKETKNREFKIVGVYDVKSTSNHMSYCYAPGEQVADIKKQTILTDGSPSFGSWGITVDDASNVDFIKKKLEDMGYIVTVAIFTEFSTEYTIKLICNSILFVSIVALLLVSLAYIKKKMVNNLYIIGLTKSLGYNSNDIRNLYLLDNTTILVISYVVSIILFIITSIVVHAFFMGRIGVLGIKWHLTLWPFIVSFLLMFIFSSIINIYYISKRIRKSLTSILNGETL